MNIETKISKILLGYGIRPHLKGFQFLKEAIKMMYEDERGQLRGHVTTIVYPTIAEKYDDRAICVERSIRHALQTAFEDFKDRPTNSEFIALVVEKLRLENQVESA